MFSLNDLHKTQRGGVALRATFAALIALGSIPGAAAVYPNFSQVAFAATSGSSNQSSDEYIDALTTAADWKTISLYYVNYQNGRTSYSPVDTSNMNSSNYRDGFLSKLKSKLRANQEKKEIPITTDSYEGDIRPALINPDKFYELYNKVTSNLSTYTKFSDASGFTESIASKPSNDTDVFLHDITEKLLKDTEDSEPKAFLDDMSSSLYVCKIDPQYDSPNTCPYFEDSANEEYGDFYHNYNNYWCYVLSGIQNKSWSFAYNTATGCMLPDRLLHESQRLYDVDGKPKYLVQIAAEGYRHDDTVYYTTKQVIERFSYELPLHTIAKFVKDATVSLPKTKALVNDQNKLTPTELRAIRDLYIPAFQEALKDDKTLDNDKITGLLSRAPIVQKGSNIVISVPGIKTQVVPVKDITQTLDARKDEAKKTINALKNINRRAKKPYLLRVKKATTPEEIDSAEKDAQTADAASADAQTARAALGKKIKDATDMLKKDAYQYATPDLKTKLDTALRNAQAAVTDFGKSATDLNGVNSTLDDAMDNLDGEDKVFDIRKKEALDKLTNYGLSEDDANKYKDAINHAEDTDGINAVLVALSKGLLAQVIRTADELKTTEAAKYTQALKATKDPFDQQLDKAKKLYGAPDAELLDLDTARTDLKDAMGKLDGEAQVQLKSKKKEAKEQLGKLGLSKEDEKKFEDDIDSAQSEDAIDKLLKDAKLTGVKTQAIQAVIETATKKKKDLETNKGTSTKDEVEAAQKEVSQFEDAAKEAISKAENEDAVNNKKDEAIGKINGVVAKNAAKAKLDAAKAQAKKIIGDLKHLEQNVKDDYCGQVDNKSTEADVKQVVEAAKAADLAKVKDAAKKTIGDLKNLEEKDKGTYTGQVDNASDEDGVNTVVKDAQAADLAKAKDNATKDIEKMNLTPDQKNAAKEAVNKAKDTDGVTQAVNDAKANEAKNNLDAAKKAAKEQLNGLGLSEQDKKPFENEINNAQDEKAVNAALLKAAKAALEKVITEATAKQKEVAYTKATKEKQQAFDTKLDAAKTAKDATDATVESLNKARTELADAMGKLDGKADAKTDLQGKKDKAKEQLNGLGLSDQDKKPFENEINNAQDEKAVNAALLKAAKAALEKVITEATAKQKEVAYTKATKEKQQAFDTKLDAAKTAKDATDATVESLNKARTELADAMGKLDGKADDKTDLQNKKEKAKEQLGGLGLSKEDEKKFEDEITNAQDDKAVDAALLKAAKAALEKVITEATAKQKEVAYTKATPAKQQEFDGKLTAATAAKDATNATVDSLNKARTELADAMGKLDGKADAKTDLQNKKDKAKETINGLQNLEKKDKDDFCGQVDKASDESGINKVVEAAKAADLAKAKEKAINNVNNMNLTPEQKKDAKKAIEDANDPAGVTKAVNDAKDKEPKQPEHVYVYDAGYIAESEAADATTTLYRLYNPWTHEHLFTTDKAEYDTLVAAGWTGEGSAGMVAVNQGKAVYRLYNPYTGEHHYTTDENELAACVKAGWVNEGIQFYSVQNGNVPVYSMYNPYEKKFYHHYTSDPDEIARMVKDGWVKEGIKWYEAK